jgi:hypothetical protein
MLPVTAAGTSIKALKGLLCRRIVLDTYGRQGELDFANLELPADHLPTMH